MAQMKQPELDVTLIDEAAADEIRLVTELIVVAADAPETLEQDVIDDVLGVDHSAGPVPPQRRAH